MRRSFLYVLTELALKDPRIVLLTGDLGYSVLEPFAEKCPERFFNVGVAEQNMVGLATGLAEAGYIPFVYSIATFASLRAYEIIRNGPIIHQYPVRIVGTGGGLEYGVNGITHHGLEDIGVMRMHPGITVILPADSEQAASALRATWNLPGPVYYRISKFGEVIPGLEGAFEFGRAYLLVPGEDVLFVTAGGITREVLKSVDILHGRGISAEVLLLTTLHPAPVDYLVGVLSRFQLVFTVEDHFVNGGLGSLVSEIVAERGLSCRVDRCGIRRSVDGRSGSSAFLYGKHGLSGKSLAEKASLAWAAVRAQNETH
jgi:transketolase